MIVNAVIVWNKYIASTSRANNTTAKLHNKNRTNVLGPLQTTDWIQHSIHQIKVSWYEMCNRNPAKTYRVHCLHVFTRMRALNSFNAKNTIRARKFHAYCLRDSHATSRTTIYANITQTGRIWVYCSWFWVVLVGFVGGFGWFCWWFWVVLGRFGWFWVVLGGFRWFWVVPCFSNYVLWGTKLKFLSPSK